MALYDQLLAGPKASNTGSLAHLVLDSPLTPPFPEETEIAIFAMGCFWGAERKFWELPGVYTTAVGYACGQTKNPTYEQVCSGRTGHAEVVLVVFNQSIVPYESLLITFFEGHDPTQGMRQGNDIGTQYRSIVCAQTHEQLATALWIKDQYEKVLLSSGYANITTEVTEDKDFYYAEPYHQQYLAANPSGYCGIGGTGLLCPTLK